MTVFLVVIAGWLAIGFVSAVVLGRMFRDDDSQPEFVCPDYYVPADWEMAL